MTIIDHMHAVGCPMHTNARGWMCCCSGPSSAPRLNHSEEHPMPYYGEEKQAYRDDVNTMQEEPPLAARLEGVLGTITRCLHALEELDHGAMLKEGVPIDRPPAGVLQLGAECEKAASALENRLLIVAKRIGRL